MTEPYLRPLLGEADSRERQRHDADEAARIASHEQMAYDAGLGRPRVTQPELPPIKAPELPPDFGQRIAELDDAIYCKGVALDRDKLVALGKERFSGLLAADRKAPRGRSGSGIDLTSFESVQYALQAFEASSIPARKMSEQLAGSGKEREQVRLITGWPDLWKATHERQEVIEDLYSFHDLFESLVFGQSLLERVSPDGRLRSHFFCGAKGRKVELFKQWLAVVQGSLVSVTLRDALWHVVSWLAGEKSESPEPVELARDFFGVRSPSLPQVRLTQALLEGFLLDYTGWPLWEQVGRATRSMPEEGRLSAWRAALARRYGRVTDFHAAVRATFYRDVGYGFERHNEFESVRHRAFLDATVQALLAQASALLALGIEEIFAGSVIAWFQGSVLLEGEHKPKDKSVSIGRQLAAAFPGFTFELEVKPS